MKTTLSQEEFDDLNSSLTIAQGLAMIAPTTDGRFAVRYGNATASTEATLQEAQRCLSQCGPKFAVNPTAAFEALKRFRGKPISESTHPLDAAMIRFADKIFGEDQLHKLKGGKT